MTHYAYVGSVVLRYTKPLVENNRRGILVGSADKQALEYGRIHKTQYLILMVA